MYQLCFYVPISHLEQVKNALFAAGAGRYDNYDCCSWQTLGQGQFRPLSGSEPYFGEINQLETLPEYKVEMICVEEKIHSALAALIASHPYEQPAYFIYKSCTPRRAQDSNFQTE
ncbi:MAG: NGG1p interacting factor NIF3 [Gammaproteobacteria bacterium]